MTDQTAPDADNQLDEPQDQAAEAPVFDYRTSKDGKVFIAWHGKTVTILKGKQALQFLARLTSLDEDGAQLAMAKITGNFKRGNERQGRLEP